VLQAVLQLLCARVDPAGLQDAVPAAARMVMIVDLSVIADDLSIIAERTPLGTFQDGTHHN